MACNTDNRDLMDFLVSISEINDLGEDINFLDRVHMLIPLKYACKKNM